MWLLQYAYTRSINRRYHLKHRNFYSQVNLDEIVPFALSTERAAEQMLTATEAARYLHRLFAVLNRTAKAIELILLKE